MFFNERKRGGGALFLPYKFGYHLFNGREKKQDQKIYCKIKLKLFRTVLIYEWFIRKKQAWEYNSMSFMKLI